MALNKVLGTGMLLHSYLLFGANPTVSIESNKDQKSFFLTIENVGDSRLKCSKVSIAAIISNTECSVSATGTRGFTYSPQTALMGNVS